MSTIIRRITTPFRSVATGGAWFFVVVSLLHLAWAVDAMWAEPAGVTKLYHTVVGQISYDAWGLTYDGRVGLWTALLQGAVVLAAAGATLIPGRRLLATQRCGHVLLLGWAALWAGNFWWLAGIDGAFDSMAQASLMSMLLVCTAGRAAFGWSPAARRTGPPAATPARVGRSMPDNEEPDMHSSEKLTPSEPSFWTDIGKRIDRIVRFVLDRLEAARAKILRMLERFRSRTPSDPPPDETVLRAARMRTAGGLKKVSRMLDRQANRLEAPPAPPAPPSPAPSPPGKTV